MDQHLHAPRRSPREEIAVVFQGYQIAIRSAARPYGELPSQHWSSVHREPPFERELGDALALSKSAIEDVLALLNRLTHADMAQRRNVQP